MVPCLMYDVHTHQEVHACELAHEQPVNISVDGFMLFH